MQRLGLGQRHAGVFARLHGHQGLAFVAVFATVGFAGRFFAVNGQPAGVDEHLALGLEMVLRHLADARGDLVLRGREEHRHEAAHHQVVQLLLGLRQAAGRLRGGDDGKVVAHLAVVEHALGRAQVVVLQRLAGKRGQVAVLRGGQHLQRLARGGQVVLGQVARIGTRVGQRLVLFVQRLGQRQGGFGRKAELAVGLALQAGQVKQQRAGLGAGLGFFGDGGGLALHGAGNGLGIFGLPQAVGLGLGVVGFFEFGVEPLARVLPGLGGKVGMHLEIFTALEGADFFLARDDERQRGRLHPAHGGQKEAAIARVERRHGPRAVDADQPIGLGAAAGRIGQALHLRIAAQVVKAIADGLRGHGLQPQALDGFAQAAFGAAGVLLDQAKDQLALAPRVAGVDELGHIFALGLLDDGGQAAFGFIDRFQVKAWRNHRQVGKAPLAAFDIELFGGLNFHQVAHRAGDHVVLALEIVVVFVKFARNGGQRPHDVLGHGGFFCNDEGFAHAQAGP